MLRQVFHTLVPSTGAGEVKLTTRGRSFHIIGEVAVQPVCIFLVSSDLFSPLSNVLLLDFLLGDQWDVNLAEVLRVQILTTEYNTTRNGEGRSIIIM
jgi:hypothetical protein